MWGLEIRVEGPGLRVEGGVFLLARASFTVDKILGVKRIGFKTSGISYKVHTSVGRAVQGVIARFVACAKIRWVCVIRNVHLFWRAQNSAN